MSSFNMDDNGIGECSGNGSVDKDEGANRPVKVCIIGGGAAGLACAATLCREAPNLIELTLIEAKRRLGGRLLTTDLWNNPIRIKDVEYGRLKNEPVLEWGAQWAHDIGDKNHSLKKYLESSKLLLSRPENQSFGNQNLFVNTREFLNITEEELSSLDEWLEAVIATKVSEHAENFQCPELSAKEVVELALEETYLKRFWNETENLTLPFPRPEVIEAGKSIILNEYTNYYGIPAHEVGFRALESDKSSIGEHRAVKNGYVRLVAGLAREVGWIDAIEENNLEETQTIFSSAWASMAHSRLELGREVTKIEQCEDGLSVQSHEVHKNSENSSDAEKFDYVVCTIPLGVLQARTSLFVPKLPESLQRSLRVLRMGLLTKVVLLWDHFEDWKQVEIPKRYLFTDDSTKTYSFVVNLNFADYHSVEKLGTENESDNFENTGPYGYCFYASLPWAVQVESMSKEEMTAAAMNLLQTALELSSNSNDRNRSDPRGEPRRPSLPAPSRVFSRGWLDDPYAKGAYSCLGVGGMLEDYDEFSKAIFDNRLHFAGEHTQCANFGCVHAALASGERAAMNILKNKGAMS